MPSIHRRGAAYRVQFYQNGKKRFRQFRRLRDANTFLARLAAKGVPDLSRVTVADMARQWLKACAVGRDGRPPLEAETIKTYTGYVNNWIIPELGNRRLVTITTSDVRDFRDALIEDRIARITAKKIVGALKGILGQALLSGEVTTNAGSGVSVRLGARETSRIEVFEVHEVNTILETAHKLSLVEDGRVGPPWIVYHKLVSVLAHTGLRLSEVRGLPRQAINFDARTLSVFQRADKSGKIGPVKSAAGQRVIHIPEKLCELLKVQIASHRHDLVFPSRTGAPLSPSNIDKRCWTPLLERAKIPHRGIHVLRHFYASRLIAMGETIKEVSTALGHADEAFTLKTYGHLFHDRDNLERRKARAELVLPSSSPT